MGRPRSRRGRWTGRERRSVGAYRGPRAAVGQHLMAAQEGIDGGAGARPREAEPLAVGAPRAAGVGIARALEANEAAGIAGPAPDAVPRLAPSLLDGDQFLAHGRQIPGLAGLAGRQEDESEDTRSDRDRSIRNSNHRRLLSSALVSRFRSGKRELRTASGALCG